MEMFSSDDADAEKDSLCKVGVTTEKVKATEIQCTLKCLLEFFFFSSQKILHISSDLGYYAKMVWQYTFKTKMVL